MSASDRRVSGTSSLTAGRGRAPASRRCALMVGIAMVAVLLPSCAAGQDVDDSAALAEASAQQRTDAELAAARAARHKLPSWLAAGIAAADAIIARQKAANAPAKPDPNALPDQDTFIDILTSVGFKDKAAKCVYTALATSPHRAQLAPAIRSLSDAVKEKMSSTGVNSIQSLASGISGTALAKLAGVDISALSAFQAEITPCLDSGTLLALYSGLSGQDGVGLGGAGGAGGLGALSTVASLAGLLGLASGGSGGSNLGVGALAGMGGLPPAAQLLAASVIAALSSGTAATSLGLDPAALDPTKIDLTKIRPEQLPLVLAAFLMGLTATQRDQLEDISGVNFNQLGIGIDPDKLTDESLGALLLVSLPFIANAISPTTAGLPAGQDASKVYVPPGADLSNINPLLFFPKDNFVGSLAGSGIQALFAGCLYEQWKAVDPLLIGAGFSGGTNLGIGQLLLGMLQCVPGVSG